MEIQVSLQKMIEASIASDLQLWPDSQRGSCIFSFLDGLDDPCCVAFVIKSPLIERAAGDTTPSALASSRQSDVVAELVQTKSKAWTYHAARVVRRPIMSVESLSSVGKFEQGILEESYTSIWMRSSI